MEPDLAELCADLRKVHGCHTAILYGSRARGDATPVSDYDVAGFAPTAALIRDARKWRGTYLDIFIYPEQRLDAADPELLKLRGGLVLFERDLAGTRLLGRLEELFKAGPEPLPRDELEARRTWAAKMLERMAPGDIEGNYRRAWLLTALLEDYFHLRHLWFAGPKESFQWLRANDPKAYSAFAEALEPGVEDRVIGRLVEVVVAEVT